MDFPFASRKTNQVQPGQGGQSLVCSFCIFCRCPPQFSSIHRMQRHNDNFLQSQKFSKALPTMGAFPPCFLQEQVQPSPLFFPEFPFIVNLSRVEHRPHLECSPGHSTFPPATLERADQATNHRLLVIYLLIFFFSSPLWLLALLFLLS